MAYFMDSKIVCLLSAASTFICSRRISRFSRSIFALNHEVVDDVWVLRF